MKTIIAVLLFSATLGAQTPPSQVKPSTAAEARRLLNLMGAPETFTRLFDDHVGSLIAALSKSRRDIPQQFWNDFAADVRKQFRPDEIIDLLVPLWAARFTPDELRQISNFYETPVGKKFIRESPSLQAEGLQVANQWGQQVFAPRVQEQLKKRLAEKHYDTETPPKARQH